MVPYTSVGDEEPENTVRMYEGNICIKGIVNCQNTLDKGVPIMQQCPLDIP